MQKQKQKKKSCLATLLGMAYGGCGAVVDKMTIFR
jgi:hypothetical protein